MSKVSYREIPMPKDKYDIKCPYTMNPQYIVVHNTANDASAENEIKYMQSNNNQVSFHIAVDDKEAVQGIPLNRNAWHASDGAYGKGNRLGIGVEICYSRSGGDRFIKAEKNTASVIADLMKKYNIGIDHVITHEMCSGYLKRCPHRTLDMGWSRFIGMILDEYDGVEHTTVPSPIFKPYIIKVNTDVLNYRTGAGVNYPIAGKIKRNERYTIVAEKDGWGKLKSGAGWINLKYTERV